MNIEAIPQELLSSLSSTWQTHLNTALIAWFLLSRAYKNIRAGGGLYGFWIGLIYGDKTPEAKAKDDAKRSAKINGEPE